MSLSLYLERRKIMIEEIRNAVSSGYKFSVTGLRQGRVRNPKGEKYEIAFGQCGCTAGRINSECKHVRWIDFLSAKPEEKDFVPTMRPDGIGFLSWIPVEE